MNKELEASTTLSHYLIVSKIGEGGMGEVYLAQDTKLDRKVAIKFLNEEFSKEEDKLSRFVREAKAASALNHPNILTVYEIGEVDGRNYIATELIDGHTLREHLAQKEALALNTILKIGVQVSEALSAAHQAGIIHRDIKPENIMIRRDGYAKVLDFGLAKLSGPPAIATGSSGSEDATRIQVNTNPGVVMGTVSYMSPEQARGNPTDARTDIWSLGIVLYEMLARKVPFTGDTTSHTIVSILEKEPLALESVPAELQRIVRKALTKDLDMRYQSARDLLIDLKNLRRDLDIQGEIERSVIPSRELTTGPIGEHATEAYNSASVAATRSSSGDQTQFSAKSSSSLEYAVTQAKSHKLVTTIVAFVLLGAIVTAGYFAFASRGGGKNQIESIAVMPFANASGNSDVDYLSDGMTETLISSLSHLPNLNVKARSTVFYYKGKEISAKKIGEELGVQAVLFGRVTQRGDDLKLSLELVNAQTQDVLWSEQYDRKQTDLITLQSDIARDVSNKLKARLSGADEAKVTKTYTASPEAYELYLKGRYHFYGGTDAEMRNASDYFQRAVEKDPNYALAYVALADSYGLASTYVLPPNQAYARVKEAVVKALQIDDGLGEAHATLGTYKLYYERDWQGAENEFKRAIVLNPNSSNAAFWYSLYLAAAGRFDESITQATRAQQLDPLSVITNSGVAGAYYLSRQFDRAIEASRKTLGLDPENALNQLFLGEAYQQKLMYSEAIAEYEKARKIDNSPWVLAQLGNGYAVAGRTADARKVLSELDAMAKERYVSPYNYALVYVGLGEKDQAFAWLNKADEERNDYLVYLKVEPLFDSLRSDPRFADLLRRVRVPQ